ncbi:ABC transporter substrate-binding protein [Subtercola boreus]|uniref:ABC transporter substrate-binding protein n=1 Tax=Subtercola boreus TaxID=120213 RepID=A0A3E0VMN7_9MICO|nr:zinc ABC transporter substrate-binding protein [Subtercola boreus]RFA10981.1 ABC transporter substrate-binding protein [Subtercola boreus]TQL55421.1 zinc/manganese transport system substrate-binding protein [Subtercola boreus]
MRTFPSSRRLAAVAAAVLASVALAGCSSGSSATSAGSSGAAASGPIAVVASTDVWGEIAAEVGGDLVTVTSIIDDPSKDPHEYEADAQNQLALSKASVVVENGGGYDDFVDTMLSSSKNTGATVVNASTVSGYDLNPSTGAFNEHLWYDFPTVKKVVDQLATSFSRIDPAEASTFTANAAAYNTKIDALIATEAELKSTFQGEGAAITEPVPLYLLDAVGLVDQTPTEFSEAIEGGTDVAPDVLASTLALFSSGQVSVLVYNEQTSGPQTEAVLAAAKAGNVPVVPVTETLGSGESYLDWMTGNLQALKTALSQ